MLHHNPRGCRDFGTVAERKQGPNAVAPDAEMLGRIPGQGGQQVLTPYPEEQTRASSLAPAFLTMGKIFPLCLRTPNPTDLWSTMGNDRYGRA